jgi:hypothetical protein
VYVHTGTTLHDIQHDIGQWLIRHLSYDNERLCWCSKPYDIEIDTAYNTATSDASILANAALRLAARFASI